MPPFHSCIMRRLMVATLLLGLGRASVAPAQAQEPSVALPPALDRVLRDYERAWAAGDSSGLAALFTPDGFVPTRTGWVRGTEAIQHAYARAGGGLVLRAHAWSTADSVGYIVGAYGYGSEPNPPDRGKFVLALRQAADGTWLIAADLDSPNGQ